MRIGIYFTPRHGEGGVYQYSVSILEALSRIKAHHFIIISTSPDIPAKFKSLKNFQIVDFHSSTRDLSIKTRNLGSSLLSKFTPHLLDSLYKLGWYNLVTPLYRASMSSSIKLINSLNLDLVFYPTSSNLSFLTKPASIVTVHDLQHRINPQFKEVSAGGRWAHREYGFVNISQKAFKIFVDSKIGKEDMHKYYPDSKGKVISLPYLAPTYLQSNLSKEKLSKIKKKLKLPEKYIYYPAKFWPHKNHLNLIKAVKLLADKGKKINLILTGSKSADFSSYDQVIKLVKQYNLHDQIKYLGYVTDLELSALYKLSQSLVMPTAFGPTNIPILEAWVLGTPVITSNIRGCRNQLSNAGLLANPYSPSDLANKIEKIYSNKKLRQTLINRGKLRVSKWTIDQFSQRINTTINTFAKIHLYD